MPQSEFAAHAWQRPSMHRGGGAGQSESSLHSTHPRSPLQIGAAPAHAFVPFAPQIALPPPGPPDPLPHARSTTTLVVASVAKARSCLNRIAHDFITSRVLHGLCARATPA